MLVGVGAQRLDSDQCRSSADRTSRLVRGIVTDQLTQMNLRQSHTQHNPPLPFHNAKISDILLIKRRNAFLLSLLRLVQNRFYAVASGYGISSISVSVSHIKSAVWAKFADSVTRM